VVAPGTTKPDWNSQGLKILAVMAVFAVVGALGIVLLLSRRVGGCLYVLVLLGLGFGLVIVLTVSLQT
jgi:hypothetical protein